MPDIQQRHGQDHGQELECAKINLLCAQIAAQPLCGFGKTENGSQIDQESGGREGGNKEREASLLDLPPRAKDEHTAQDDEQTNGEDLVGQTTQQDVVGSSGVLLLLLLHTDQSRACDLSDGGDNVRGDEEPQNPLGGKERVFTSQSVDESGQDGVDTGGQKHWGGDDEEVLEDKEDEVVRVDLGGQAASDVADDLEGETYGKGAKVHGAVSDDLEQVGDKIETKENRGQESEGERRSVAVDDDGRIVGTAREWPVRVDIAAAAGVDAGWGSAAGRDVDAWWWSC